MDQRLKESTVKIEQPNRDTKIEEGAKLKVCTSFCEHLFYDLPSWVATVREVREF